MIVTQFVNFPTLSEGVCACSECFEEGPSGRCVNVECEDWRYDQSERECVDNRPKQLTAFLLSLFISSTGAANFYIGRNDLGKSLLKNVLSTLIDIVLTLN